jgi:hypothetical protein
MIIRNRLESSFGPYGGSTGFFLLLGGLAGAWFSLYSLILAVLGAFIAFTSTGTLIDTERKRIKFINYIFGIIPFGKWMDIKPGMKLGLKRSHKGYQAYTRGNQPVSMHKVDIRIVLYEEDNDEIMPVRKFPGKAEAADGIKELSLLLNIPCNDTIIV